MIRSVSRNRKSFILTGGDNNAADVIKKLHEYGMESLRLAVGEKLSFADERIIKGTTAELLDQEFDSLSVIYAENDEADKTVRTGINDDEFIRGNVPMTKSEVRAISMSKLSVSPDSVVWDVGAGTGSVSIECALSAYEGEVFAVEKNPEATALLKENAYKFRTDNIHIIEGSAPEALEDLPAPTHVFIGGSSGNLKQIISLILSKNKDAVIVVNTVTLETQAEVSECVKYFGFGEFEAVSAEISRSRKAGSYNLMTALNPVWIFRMRGGNPA